VKETKYANDPAVLDLIRHHNAILRERSSGNVAAGTDVTVNFNTSGTLQDVYVKVGQHVNGGQLLAIAERAAHIAATGADLHRFFAAWVSGNASGGGELLFGRKTYQMMEAFWPTPLAAQQMPIVAQGMNAARKYVASRTLTRDDLTWNTVLLSPANAIAEIAALRDRDGGDLVVWGSASLATALVAEGLVDELNLMIEPILLGGGKRIFPAGLNRSFRLTSATPYPTGVVGLQFKVDDAGLKANFYTFYAGVVGGPVAIGSLGAMSEPSEPKSR
jgi:dihydrofolate reductase